MVQTLHKLYALVTSTYCTLPLFIANLVDCRGFSGAGSAKFFEDTIAAQLANELVICGVIIDNLAAQRDRVRRQKALGCPMWEIENKHAPACYFRAMRSSRNAP
jgi:hypothetical protein